MEKTFSFNTHPLTSQLRNVEQLAPNKWRASCPCGRNHKHDDKNQSLTVEYDQEKQTLLVYCFTGCTVAEICAETGCSIADLFIGKNPSSFINWFAEKNGLTFIESYSYCYGPYNDGLCKVRFRKPDGTKDFRWLHADDKNKSGFAMKHSGQHRLYAAGSLNNNTVIIVEGEKDANTVHNLINATAVSAENGASRSTGGKWREEYTKQLTGKTVYILWDNDEIGKQFAQIEAQNIVGTAAAVFLLDLPQAWPDCPEKADITDYVKAVGPEEAAQTMAQLIATAEEYHLPKGVYSWDDIIPETSAQDPQQTTTETISGITVHTGPGAAAPAKEPEKLVVTGFDDVEIKPTDYLFFPWFPRGKLVAIQGDSSSSKSTFMYAVGAAVSTGSDLLSVPCEDPGNVMFITIEDDEGDIKISFQDAGGDTSHLRRIRDREQIAKLNLSPAGAQTINEIIKAENIKLLVLDPIQQFLTGDMNKANETRPQLARLMNIAAENNICIAFIEHIGKDTSKAALHRGIGSVDIGAATRSIIQVVTDPTDDYYKIAFTVKNNTADFHETQRAIRYQVKDHPGSYNPEEKKRSRFHGHAEFSEIIPEYNERLYRRAMRKADEAAEEEEALLFTYDDDPLVITARQLIAENPQGLFIGTDDLIRKITECCGRCPYDQTKSKATSIYARVNKLRNLMIDTDGIQADKQSNSIYPKVYNWRGALTEPAYTRTKGFVLTPVNASKQGYQQTKI